MASSIGRELTIKMMANTKDFQKGIRKSETTLQKFGTALKLGAATGVAAFGALGTAALRFGSDALQAAAEEEASSKKLATALKNTTKATDKQIDSVEKWIETQQLSLGISDAKLRPAFQKLATATGDLTKAQELTTLAMDIAAGTGKDLDAVALGLSKAYNGNIGALTRLGVPLDANIIKTKDFDAATKVLSETFAGQAQTSADTYQGRLNKLNEAWGEFKETIGQSLMPVMTRFIDYLTNTVMPTLKAIGDGFYGTTNDSVSNKVKSLSRELDGKSGAQSLGESLRSVVDSFKNLTAALTGENFSKATTSLERVANAFESIADAIDKVAGAYRRWNELRKKLPDGTISTVLRSINPLLKGFATGGTVSARKPIIVGENGAEVFVPSGAGSIVPNNRIGAGGGNTYNITMNGIVDAESARRSIEKILQDSSRRNSPINLAGGFV